VPVGEVFGISQAEVLAERGLGIVAAAAIAVRAPADFSGNQEPRNHQQSPVVP
jgi:hypothetical protein